HVASADKSLPLRPPTGRRRAWQLFPCASLFACHSSSQFSERQVQRRSRLVRRVQRVGVCALDIKVSSPFGQNVKDSDSSQLITLAHDAQVLAREGLRGRAIERHRL